MLETIDHGPVRELRLARPPANALSPELITALRAAVETAPGEGAGALLLSGAPGMFSAGLDVPHLLTLNRAAIRATWEEFYGLMRGLAASPVPVAAAITGHSPAGGAVLALFCDHRVMAEGKFAIGLNEVEVGLPMPPPILRALTWLVGPRQAARLTTGAVMLPAAEALRVGFVDELAPPAEVVDRARAWCEGLLALPPTAMGRTRELARAGLAAVFEGEDEGGVERLVDDWFSAETQGALRALVRRLAERAQERSGGGA